ncbi:MAG: radical SAM protein [Acidobacteriia bacterium]|nr:radical SAM protein [Terriglobia bacterium]
MANFLRVAAHPWIAARLAALQGEKWFFDALYPRSAEGRASRIRQVGIRITDLCNLRCRTCGQWGEGGFLLQHDPKALKQDEVTPARYQQVFADLVAHGHRPILYFWGGEPMLYPGILELVATGARLQLPVAIATNGTRVAAAAEQLVRAPLFLLQISIDGHTADLHNRLRPATGRGDNFQAIESGLEAVHKARTRRTGLPMIASLTTISRENGAHLIDIYDTFRERVDMFVFYLSWWIDEADAAAHEQDFSRRFGSKPTLHRGWIGQWKADDHTGLAGQIEALLSRSREPGAVPVTFIPFLRGEEALAAYYTNHRERFGYDQCISIFQVIEVNSNGDVSPCRDYHDYVVGNVKTTTLSELWNSERYLAFRRSLATEGLMPVCSRCCGLMGY